MKLAGKKVTAKEWWRCFFHHLQHYTIAVAFGIACILLAILTMWGAFR